MTDQHQQQRPRITVQCMQVTARGRLLLSDRQSAQRTGQQAQHPLKKFQVTGQDQQPQEASAFFQAGNSLIMATTSNGSTKVLITPETGRTDENIRRLAAVTAALYRLNNDQDRQQTVEVDIIMSADRPPPEWRFASEMSHDRTIKTESGATINHHTTVSRDLKREGEGNPEPWRLTGQSETDVPTAPDQEEIETALRATYTETVLNMAPELRCPTSERRPLPVRAEYLGVFADVVATELQYITELCERYDQHRVPAGSVAAVTAIRQAIENAENIRPALDLIQFDAPSLAQPAAASIDASMDTLRRKREPYDPDTTPALSSPDVVSINTAAHLMGMAAKRKAIARCAEQMTNPKIPADLRRTYRTIAEAITQASTDHLEAALETPQAKDHLTRQHPELARRMTDVFADAEPHAMTAFHQACHAMDHQEGQDPKPESEARS